MRHGGKRRLTWWKALLGIGVAFWLLCKLVNFLATFPGLG